MILRVADRMNKGVVEFESYCHNGIRITIRNDDNEMSAYIRDEDILEAVNKCKEYADKRHEEVDARMKKREEKREERKRAKDDE